MEPFYLGAYWGSRAESPALCGQRLAGCIAQLGEINQVLASWFRRGSTKAAARSPIDLDADSLGRLLTDGVNRRDDDGRALDELGYSFSLWNRNPIAVGLSGTVGAHPSTPDVLNSLVLSFPPPEAEALSLYEASTAEAIVKCVVDSWEPSWATWTSHRLRDVQETLPREPVIGWMTYLATPVPEDLRGPKVQALCGGSLVIAGSSVTAIGVPGVLDVRGSLAAAGALRPIP